MYKNYQDHFTHADEIRGVMIDLLGNTLGKTILEPAAGDGIFIRNLKGKPKRVNAVELNSKHAAGLRLEFGNKIHILEKDFIDLFVRGGREKFLTPPYDALICNPPYGLDIPINYRKEIKKKFPTLYARESYGLFIHFSLDLLKRNGRYVYIVPDTFFTSRNHASLREKFIKEAAPTHILQFPSKKFKSVKFGYGNLCIIAGHKHPLTKTDEIKWLDLTKSDLHLSLDVLNKSKSIPGSVFFESGSKGWIHPNRKRVFQGYVMPLVLGDIAECRTGIYTGNNNRYLRKMGRLKNGFVPIVRGGHRAPLEKTTWAIDWRESALHHYKTDKKARFQNSTFYFKRGLAVPMVTSGRLSASLMDNSLFDQGVVGVFPENPEDLEFLLVYLNSKEATILKNSIFPSTNNSANTLKKLPVPKIDSHTRSKAKTLVQKTNKRGWENTKEERESLVRYAFGLSTLKEKYKFSLKRAVFAKRVRGV